MKCPKCNVENEEKAAICISCGESLLPDSILLRQFYTGDPYPDNLPLVKLASLFWGRVKRKPFAVLVILVAVCFVAYVLLLTYAQVIDNLRPW